MFTSHAIAPIVHTTYAKASTVHIRVGLGPCSVTKPNTNAPSTEMTHIKMIKTNVAGFMDLDFMQEFRSLGGTRVQTQMMEQLPIHLVSLCVSTRVL
jgi:hypothetical protein